jgi:hypothetical protein
MGNRTGFHFSCARAMSEPILQRSETRVFIEAMRTRLSAFRNSTARVLTESRKQLAATYTLLDRASGPVPTKCDLTVVCAWCQWTRGADGQWQALPVAPGCVGVSHGICPRCFDLMLAEARANPHGRSD